MECPGCEMDFRDPVTGKSQHHPWCYIQTQILLEEEIAKLKTSNSKLRESITWIRHSVPSMFQESPEAHRILDVCRRALQEP